MCDTVIRDSVCVIIDCVRSHAEVKSRHVEPMKEFKFSVCYDNVMSHMDAVCVIVIV